MHSVHISRVKHKLQFSAQLEQERPENVLKVSVSVEMSVGISNIMSVFEEHPENVSKVSVSVEMSSRNTTYCRYFKYNVNV